MTYDFAAAAVKRAAENAVEAWYAHQPMPRGSTLEKTIASRLPRIWTNRGLAQMRRNQMNAKLAAMRGRATHTFAHG
jgi:hypothetical protein